MLTQQLRNCAWTCVLGLMCVAIFNAFNGLSGAWFIYRTLNGQEIPFVNSVKYLSVIFDKKITWRLHIKAIEAKAFSTFIRICSLFKSEWLNTNIKLTLHKVLIRSAETHLLKFQCLQNSVLHTTGNFLRRTSIRDKHVAFQIPLCLQLHNKLCRRQAEIIQNHENENNRNMGQGETPHRIYKWLQLDGGHVYDCSSV
jgi:hypothetical protein